MAPIPPSVVRTFRQTITGSGKQGERELEKREKEKKEKNLPKGGHTTLQEVGFVGFPLEGKARTFPVLAGKGAPRPTEGWPKIQKIARFQRVSVTFPEGYDPYVLDVPILFDAVRYVQGRRDIEADIQTLEWMAGREPHSDPEGPPPQVAVFSTDSAGNLTSLIPKQFQIVPGSAQLWWLSGIDFDENAERDRGGDRLRQWATVTLTQVVLTPEQVNEARGRREKVKDKYEIQYTTAEVNTIKRMAVSLGVPAAVNAILKANRHVTTNPDRPLRDHTAIRIPLVLFKQVGQ